MKSFYSGTSSIAFRALLFLSINGCSVLIGKVKPVEEKAVEPGLTPVSQINPNWKALNIRSQTDSAASASHENSDENEAIPDAAWQSTVTAAIISLNSACRQKGDILDSPKEITATITSAWANLKIMSEIDLSVSSFPALETTAQGVYLDQVRKFQLLVVKSPRCIYDIIYLSPLKTFEQENAVFRQFRDSLRLK